MPDFQDDDFALFGRKFGQATHGGQFPGRFVGLALEPAVRFKLPRHTSPEGTAAVQSAVAEGAEQVASGLLGWDGQLEQFPEDFLNDILGLTMAQAQRASVKDERGGLRFVKRFAPGGGWRSVGHCV